MAGRPWALSWADKVGPQLTRDSKEVAAQNGRDQTQPHKKLAKFKGDPLCTTLLGQLFLVCCNCSLQSTHGIENYCHERGKKTHAAFLRRINMIPPKSIIFLEEKKVTSNHAISYYTELHPQEAQVVVNGTHNSVWDKLNDRVQLSRILSLLVWFIFTRLHTLCPS